MALFKIWTFCPSRQRINRKFYKGKILYNNMRKELNDYLCPACYCCDRWTDDDGDFLTCECGQEVALK